MPLAMLARVARLDKMPLRKPWPSVESLGIAPSSRVPPSERIALKTLIATLSGASAAGQTLHTLLHSTLSEALGGWHRLPPSTGSLPWSHPACVPGWASTSGPGYSGAGAQSLSRRGV